MPLIWYTKQYGHISHQSENKDTIFQMEGVSMMWLMSDNSFVIDSNEHYPELE